MPFIIKVSYSGQIRRINFPKFPDFQLFHTRLVELFGEIPGGYRVLNLISANGLPICDVAEHEGDWASASANFTNALNNVTTLLKCSIEPVLNSPREYVEAIAAAKAASLGSASAASCCAVEEGKREMKDLLENFLKDFQRSYGETFGDELNDVLSAPQPAPTQAPAPAPAPAPVPVPIPVAPTSTRRESRQGPFAAFSAVPALNAAPMMARPARPPRPEEGVLHPNIWCDRCGEHIRGIRFKCNDCPDYDLCSKCTMNHDADTIHCAAFDHSFKMITSPEPTGPASIFPRARRPTRPQANSSTAPIVHHRITCDGCNIGPIIGVRHKCLDCPDFDFCDRCKTEDTTHDPEHEFLPLLQPGRVVIHDRTRVPRRNAPVIPPAPTAPAPVPETTSAPRARTAHNATCNLCASRIYGIRYKCANCPDYDVCESCFRITEDQHPTHTFVKVTQLTDIVYRHTRKNSVRHRAVCDGPGCRKTIVGIRYKCMHPSCADFDLCEDCESLPIPVHPIDHPMLKMRTLKARVPSLVANPVVPTVLPHTRAEPIIQIPLPHIPVMEPTPKAMNAPLSVFHTPTQEGTFHLPASTQTHESPRSVASVQTPKMEVTVVGTQTMTEPVLDIKPEPVDVVEPISAPRPLSPIFSARPLSPTIIELPSVPKNEPSVAAIPILEEYPTPAAVPVPIPVRPFTPEMQQSPSILPASLLTRPALTPAPLSAAFVEDVNVPDGTTFPPGAEFIKSWKMVNDGNTEWSADTVLAFVGGDRMGAFKNAPTQYEVGRVPAGESIDVWAADLKAPEDSGVYSSFWRLRNGPEGDFFGHRLWVSIEVAAPSHSDSSSSPSLASSTLAMPGAFFQAPSDVPTIASTPAHPTVPSTTTSVITPATISSQDESVSFIDSVSEDGSVVEIPVAATSSQAAPTTSASAATLTPSPAPRPASPNDEDGFIVVYDSASSTDGM